jgi:hypothetical protein
VYCQVLKSHQDQLTHDVPQYTRIIGKSWLPPSWKAPSYPYHVSKPKTNLTRILSMWLPPILAKIRRSKALKTKQTRNPKTVRKTSLDLKMFRRPRLSQLSLMFPTRLPVVQPLETPKEKGLTELKPSSHHIGSGKRALEADRKIIVLDQKCYMAFWRLIHWNHDIRCWRGEIHHADAGAAGERTTKKFSWTLLRTTRSCWGVYGFEQDFYLKWIFG